MCDQNCRSPLERCWIRFPNSSVRCIKYILKKYWNKYYRCCTYWTFYRYTAFVVLTYALTGHFTRHANSVNNHFSWTVKISCHLAFSQICWFTLVYQYFDWCFLNYNILWESNVILNSLLERKTYYGRKEYIFWNKGHLHICLITRLI